MNSLLEFIQTHEEAFRSRTRLASLYSDFRLQRSTNPDGYAANSDAWLRALSAAADAGLLPSQTAGQHDRVVIRTGEELSKSLQTPQYGRPLALASVVQSAVEKGELIPLPEFLSSRKSRYAQNWVPTPWQIVGWGLKQLGIVGSSAAEDKLVAGDFVIRANLEPTAKTVLKQVARTANSNATRIFSRELFAAEVSSALNVDEISPNDLSVLLVHLSRDEAVATYDAIHNTIKLKSPTEQSPSSISKEDINIASLRTLIASLEHQVESLNAKISELDRKSREAVSAKNTTAAKSALRSKKMVEGTLQQRSATLHQLEEVYAKIEQAADQIEIVRVMETAGQTLKSLNERTGGVDRVQDIMDGLKEEMMNADEIGQAINETGAEGVDETEVEDELEEMEKAERQKREEQERKEREVREDAERKQREQLVEKEAEITRQRLAELDRLDSREASASHESKDSTGTVDQATHVAEDGKEAQSVSAT